MISKELIAAILDQYRLSPAGIHGISHWARVYENGQRLAQNNGAYARVTALFAVFHDACRVSDGADFFHGRRGAQLAKQMRGSFYELDDAEFELLYRACAQHTEGRVKDSGAGLAALTVQTCWDSDRLDLPRVGIRINPHRLATDTARQDEILRWAEERSTARLLPDWVSADWTALRASTGEVGK
jgi:uncharacterized protein